MAAEANISRIDSINDIAELGSIMKRLKISGVGPKTMDEMKTKVYEAIEESQRIAGWSAGEVILSNLSQYLLSFTESTSSRRRSCFI